jgi:hypothetical protein
MLLVGLACAIMSFEYQRHIRWNYIPLADAVATFNRTAANDPVGRTQAPLTAAEVTAAIRRQLSTVAREDARAHDILARIASTGMIPRNARLHSMTTYSTGAAVRPVWWINLDISTDDSTGLGFGLRIREGPASGGADGS